MATKTFHNLIKKLGASWSSGQCSGLRDCIFGHHSSFICMKTVFLEEGRRVEYHERGRKVLDGKKHSCDLLGLLSPVLPRPFSWVCCKVNPNDQGSVSDCLSWLLSWWAWRLFFLWAVLSKIARVILGCTLQPSASRRWTCNTAGSQRPFTNRSLDCALV